MRELEKMGLGLQGSVVCSFFFSHNHLGETSTALACNVIHVV